MSLVSRSAEYHKFQYCTLSLVRNDDNDQFYFCRMQLLYELCLEPLTSVPIMDLLSTKKYQFFSEVHPHFLFQVLFWCHLLPMSYSDALWSHLYLYFSTWRQLELLHCLKGLTIRLFVSVLCIRFAKTSLNFVTMICCT